MGRCNNPIIRKDGKVFMVIPTVEPMEDENGKTYFKEYDREEDITGREDREHDWCKLCRFGKYPECLEWCDDYK